MKKLIQVTIICISVLLIAASFVSAKGVAKTIMAKPGTVKNKSLKLNVSPTAQKKMGGLLLKRTLAKRAIIDAMKKGKNPTRQQLHHENIHGKIDKEIVAIYLTRKPTKLFEKKLEALGVKRKGNVWVSAVGRHRYGFAYFTAPIDKIETLVEMPEIMRIDSAERTFGPQLNKAAKELGMNLFWNNSSYYDYRGNGLTVGLIDTGYDVGNTDLPEPIAKWAYPGGVLDTNADVSDNTSGHGTYIAGCLVGKGILSGDNQQMLGISTGMSVHVVKASTTNSYGMDIFEESTVVQALEDLAASNAVDMINLSIGAWDEYHDGSSQLEQAIDDLAIIHDIPVFCAAGNLGDQKRHFLLPMEKNKEYQVLFKVTTTNHESFKFSINYVSADGFSVDVDALDFGRSIYPSQISSTAGDNVDEEYTNYTQTISTKGIVRQRYQDQEWAFHDNDTYHPSGEEIDWLFGFYITNKISTNRFIHIYIDSYDRLAINLEFQNDNSDYTVTSPGNADRAFTVGASVSRQTYNCVSNVDPSTTTPLGDVAAFSGRGPRVDLDPFGTLDLTDLSGVGTDYRFKPDFVCPGQYVVSLFDSNVRSNYWGVDYLNTPPPAYSLSHVGTSAWHFSLPSDTGDQGRFYTNGTLNFWCPLDSIGDANNGYKNNIGTSPSSVIGVGCAATILSKWAGLTMDELRRYMRPGGGALPHKPGNYNTDVGFGILEIYNKIFGTTGYISNEFYCVINFEAPCENDLSVRITNNPVVVSGNFYNVFKTENFIITNYVTGWSTNVNWTAMTERLWWMTVPLSNYINQTIEARYLSVDGCDVITEEIQVWRSHGLNSPEITITNPTDTGKVSFDPTVNEVTLGGNWSDDSDIGTADSITIKWDNLSTGESGTITNVVATSHGQGTWTVTIPIENPSYNKFMITATDDDGDSAYKYYEVDNGSKEYDISKVNFKVNLAKPGKDLLKIKGEVNSTSVTSVFTVGMDFTIGLVQTNGVVTNLLTFVTTADNIKAKGRKAIYLDKVKGGHVFKVVASRKKNDDTIKLKVTMKKFDGLEDILEIDPVDVKKKDSTFTKAMTFKGEVCGFIYNSDKIDCPYWGKIGKNIIGKETP